MQRAVDWLDVILTVENPLLVAHFHKARYLVGMRDGQQALETLDLLFQANTILHDHPAMEFIREKTYAIEQKDLNRCEILREQISGVAEKHGLPAIPLHPSYGFLTFILQGMAHHSVKNWDEAFKSFMTANFILNNSQYDSDSNRITLILASLACYYDAKDYKTVLSLTDNSSNVVYRRFPGMHKWKALALEKLGRLDDAIVTMSQAVLYETPWNPINQDECLKLYDELCSRRRTTKCCAVDVVQRN